MRAGKMNVVTNVKIRAIRNAAMISSDPSPGLLHMATATVSLTPAPEIVNGK